jgi:phospholipid/cholesterol/gamma-HCH transport system substrate-binding protein
MESSKREQAWVGLFVLVASGLLLATIFALSGAFGREGDAYRAYFRFAGGLEPGATVRVGGIKSGRVEQLRLDPQDSSRVEVLLRVKPGTQIKSDSVAKITSLSALGENYLEVTLGSPAAPAAAPGSVLQSREYFGIGELSETLSSLSPEVQQLAKSLNARVAELQETIARVNDLLNDTNRANVSSSLGNVRGMLEENRPALRSTMTNVESASAKVAPLLDDFKKTVKDATEAIAKVDTMLGENRTDIRDAVAKLRETLAHADSLVGQLDRTMGFNAEGIDEILENIRLATENLKQFTDRIRTRPDSLIRSSAPADRKPGGKSKQ